MANSERMQLLKAEEADIRGRIAGLASRLEINLRMQAGIGRQFDGAGADSHGDTTAAVVCLSVPLTRPKSYRTVATLPVPLKRPIAYRPQAENDEKAEAAAVDLGAVKEELEDEELRKELRAALVGDVEAVEELQAAVDGGRCGNEDAESEAGEAAVKVEATDDEADEEPNAAGDEDEKLEADELEDPDAELDDNNSKPQAAASGSGSARSRSPVRTRVVRVPPPLLKRLPPPASKARPKLHPAPPQKPPPLRLQLPPWRLPPPEVREWDEAQVDKWLEESNW